MTRQPRNKILLPGDVREAIDDSRGGKPIAVRIIELLRQALGVPGISDSRHKLTAEDAARGGVKSRRPSRPR